MRLHAKRHEFENDAPVTGNPHPGKIWGMAGFF